MENLQEESSSFEERSESPLEQFSNQALKIKNELKKVIIGQDDMIDLVDQLNADMDKTYAGSQVKKTI